MRERYRKFYGEYKTKLFGYLLHKCGDYETALEVTQESFTRHLQHYGAAASASPSLLFTIARNALIDHQRRSNRFTTIDESFPTALPNSEHRVIAKERSARVFKAMQRLSDMDREVLLLAIKGVPYKDIAKTLNISIANVKVRVHRARTGIRKELSELER